MRGFRGSSLGLVPFFLFGGGAHSWAGRRLDVPSAVYPNIQTAIRAAQHGDEIVVGPGVYHETIQLLGKGVLLRSAQGPQRTTINAAGLNDSVVKCVEGEGRDTVLLGFTLTGGTGEPAMIGSESAGGGLLTRGSRPTIANCIFKDNSARGSSSCSLGGGGAYCYQGAPLFINCVFAGNSAAFPPGCGGAIHNVFAETVMINCTFYNNAAGRVGGVIGGATAVNSIFWGNEGWPYDEGAQVFLIQDVQHSIIQDLLTYVGNGNLAADPLFADPANGDLRLRPDSPGIHAGSNTLYMENAAALGLVMDLEGNPRFVGFLEASGDDNLLGMRIDIGPYEFGASPGDLDHDGDIDLMDVALLLPFFTGP